MALVLNGSNNTIGGLAVGGLPDGTVDDDTLAAGTGGKVLKWSVFTNNTRTELSKTTSGNTNRVTLWSVSVNKTVASSTLAWFGHVPTHDDHSAGLQMVTDYGGTEIPGGWSFTYTPTGWTGTINLSGYISGHTTTGAQNLIFKYYFYKFQIGLQPGCP